MKFAALLLTLAFTSQSFAGAYGFECHSKDKSLSIGKGSMTLVKVDGSKIEASYFSDSSNQLSGWEMQDFLQQSQQSQQQGSKLIVDRPGVINNADNLVKQISKRPLKDDCGHVGERRVFKETVRVLDLNGTELKSAVPVICTEDSIPGECA